MAMWFWKLDRRDMGVWAPVYSDGSLLEFSHWLRIG
jgi:hypothetical protein